MNNTASGIYHPRNATDSPLWNVLNNHYDDFEKHYEEKYEKKYGYFRPVIKKVVEEIFRARVLKMLKKEEKIGDELINNLMNWKHSCLIIWHTYFFSFSLVNLKLPFIFPTLFLYLFLLQTKTKLHSIIIIPKANLAWLPNPKKEILINLSTYQLKTKYHPKGNKWVGYILTINGVSVCHARKNMPSGSVYWLLPLAVVV